MALVTSFGYNCYFHYMKQLYALVLTGMLLAIGRQGFAQQVEEFNLVRESAIALNPALTGASGFVNVTAAFRRQFMSINQSPYTAYLNYNMQFERKNVGLGASAIYDATGPTGKAGATIALAYQFNFDKKGRGSFNNASSHMLTLGISASVLQYRLDGTKLVANDINDPELTFKSATRVFPDASFGIYYQYKQYLNVNISVPQIMGLDLNYKKPDGTASFRRIPHLYGMVQGRLDMAPGKFSVDPVFAMRWVYGAPWQIVTGARMVIYNTAWVGFNYRTKNAVQLEGGFNIKQWVRLAYVYDFILEDYRASVGQTHELALQIFLDKKGKKKAGGL
jgi:type IX secretion system PorP/SprF family membrane protein